MFNITKPGKYRLKMRGIVMFDTDPGRITDSQPRRLPELEVWIHADKALVEKVKETEHDDW